MSDIASVEYSLKEVLDRIDRRLETIHADVSGFEKRLSNVEFRVGAIETGATKSTDAKRWMFSGPVYLAVYIVSIVLAHVWK